MPVLIEEKLPFKPEPVGTRGLAIGKGTRIAKIKYEAQRCTDPCGQAVKKSCMSFCCTPNTCFPCMVNRKLQEVL